MKKNKKILIGLICLFVVLLGTTLFVSFSSNLDVQEVIVKSITPVYDETSGVVVSDEGVVFNDKNQVVKYNVVLENTQDYDVKISNINLSTPTEEFLDYKVEGINKDDVIEANSTKELVVSFETMGIEGWGRNFADELTANVSFERVVKQEETPKEEEKQPEAPATNIEEVINKSEKIEVEKITNNTIEFKEGIKLEDGEKAETWIYPETKFYGYNEVDESNVIKEIVLENDKLDELEVKSGEHNVVISTEEKEVLGYVEIYINENKELLIEKTQDTTDKEENKLSVNKPSEDKEEEPKEDEEGKIENPYTSDKGLIVVLVIATGVTGLAIIVVSKNKFAKYTVFILMLSPAITITNAEEVIELPVKFNVSFESQNVMVKSFEDYEYCYEYDENDECIDEWSISKFLYFWEYKERIENIYIQNSITEIEEYAYQFDVTEEQNGRVKAYLVSDGERCYYDDVEDEDVCRKMFILYLQADGIIYPNEDASYYFQDMILLDKIENLDGIDTSNVTNMSGMFNCTGYYSEDLTLDLSNFDTSKVTNMSYMFGGTGHNSEVLEIDVSNFDTSKVTNMDSMFRSTGGNSPNFTLDVSNFDTSKVTNMDFMFLGTGSSNPNFNLDVSNFDTSKVTNMDSMFLGTGYNSTKFVTSITIRNPRTTVYYRMFRDVATKEGSKITVNYTSKTSSLVDEMIATKSDGSNVVKGNCIDCGEGYIPIGTEISIGDEKFNVISQTDDTVTMLAQLNLGTDYKQSININAVMFADRLGWEYTPGPKEIDIQTWSSNPKTYVNAYVEYLKTELGDNSVTGDLITLKELKALGCTIQDDYIWSDEQTCENSPYKSWLINNQGWWIRSAEPTVDDNVWCVNNYSELTSTPYRRTNGVRPVITISKDTLKNLN